MSTPAEHYVIRGSVLHPTSLEDAARIARNYAHAPTPGRWVTCTCNTCPRCGQLIETRDDGTLQTHGSGVGLRDICPGSHRAAETTTATALAEADEEPMGEFAPTRVQVRDAFIRGSVEDGSGGDFDLWLARHDRAVLGAVTPNGEQAARALEDAAEGIYDEFGREAGRSAGVARWLRVLAASYRAAIPGQDTETHWTNGVRAATADLSPVFMEPVARPKARLR